MAKKLRIIAILYNFLVGVPYPIFQPDTDNHLSINSSISLSQEKSGSKFASFEVRHSWDCETSWPIGKFQGKCFGNIIRKFLGPLCCIMFGKRGTTESFRASKHLLLLVLNGFSLILELRVLNLPGKSLWVSPNCRGQVELKTSAPATIV